jgi:hypothetical protein
MAKIRNDVKKIERDAKNKVKSLGRKIAGFFRGL